VRIFDEIQIEKMEIGTLTSQELVKGFHKVVKWFPIGIVRVVKESFSPSFAGLAAEEDTPNSSESKNLKNEKSNKKKIINKESTLI